MYIGGEEVRTGKKAAIHPPHEQRSPAGIFSCGDAKHVKMAIDAALKCKGRLGII